MAKSQKKIKFEQKFLFIIFLLFISFSIQAQDDEGPAPPPPAASVNMWIPTFTTLALVLGCFALAKK